MRDDEVEALFGRLATDSLAIVTATDPGDLRQRADLSRQRRRTASVASAVLVLAAIGGGAVHLTGGRVAAPRPAINPAGSSAPTPTTPPAVKCAATPTPTAKPPSPPEGVTPPTPAGPRPSSTFTFAPPPTLSPGATSPTPR